VENPAALPATVDTVLDMSVLSPAGWPGSTTVSDPDGVSWTVWHQRTAWRPRSLQFFAALRTEAATPDLAPRMWGESRRDRQSAFLVEGLALIAAGVVALLVEAVLLVVLGPVWWLARRVTGRPAALQVYRDDRWSRTHVVDPGSIDGGVRDLVAEITSGAIGAPREVYRQHRPWLTTSPPTRQ
jgi:hypothetical protein